MCVQFCTSRRHQNRRIAPRRCGQLSSTLQTRPPVSNSSAIPWPWCWLGSRRHGNAIHHWSCLGLNHVFSTDDKQRYSRFAFVRVLQTKCFQEWIHPKFGLNKPWTQSCRKDIILVRTLDDYKSSKPDPFSCLGSVPFQWAKCKHMWCDIDLPLFCRQLGWHRERERERARERERDVYNWFEWPAK